MKNQIRKEAGVYLIPDYMETRTITTYSLVNEAFLRTYFPEFVYGLTPNKKFKRRKH